MDIIMYMSVMVKDEEAYPLSMVRLTPSVPTDGGLHG
jgi:hypothetical protein